jgi:OOP family OmpA-OmpF porin
MKQQKQTGLCKTVTRLAISTVVLVGFSLPVSADWYGAISFGESELSEDVCAGLAGCSEDLKDTGWKLAVGNQLNTNAAVEFGYVDLGEASASAAGVTCKADAKGFQASLVGSLPTTNQFSFTGRVGLFRWDADGSCSGAVSLSGSDSGTDLTFGVGVRYDMTKTVSLRGEWERFDVDDDDIDLLSLGLMFMFK